ncbi:DUF2163 domain-containing protein [Devosia submarina]|uniref:DUF2163 domain-containing protein n=1 Tax=Devosia submarina TaxID=1173082 RepID=UPI000D345CBB|nr:DUF2163 domain-containing protein [Devosia submarina]
MRTLEPGFAALFAQGETTLANCWRIERQDGLVLGFTDHDEALRFGETDFVPAHGLDGGEAPSKLGAQVETSEVLGMLHAEAISEHDILLGRYDGAEVQTWRVNWMEPSQRLLLRTDTIGEIVREDGVFRAELRSGQQTLNRTRGRVYQGMCDASVGDGRCGVDLDQPAFTATAGVLGFDDPYRLIVAGLEGYAANWFAFGTVIWTGGRRIGLRDGVLTHTRSGNTDILSFAVKLGDWVAVGDTLTVLAGCDRRFATCKGKFGNGVNFRGFPHIPGSDYVLRHPRSGQAMDGRAVVK